MAELEEGTTNEEDNDNLLEELVATDEEDNAHLEAVTSDIEVLEDETSVMAELEEGTMNNHEVLQDLFQEEDNQLDGDFLEMMPTEQESTATLDEFASSDDQDPFADLFESDSESTSQDPDDPFAELLGDESEKPDEEFLNLLQADDDDNSSDHESSNHQQAADWDSLLDDTSADNGQLDDPFSMEEMFETSKSHTST